MCVCQISEGKGAGPVGIYIWNPTIYIYTKLHICGRYLREWAGPVGIYIENPTIYVYIQIYLCVAKYLREKGRVPVSILVCSADGSTHIESNKLYRKVKHRYRPNRSPRQRPTAKARHDQAALAASAEARGATHRARPRKIRAYGATRLYTHPHELPALTALAQHI